MKTYPLLLLASLVFMPLTARAAEKDPNDATATVTNATDEAGGFVVETDLGYRQSLWIVGFRRDVLDFHTEGLKSFDLGLTASYNRQPVAFYLHEGPVDSSPSQHELFEQNVDRSAALKKVKAGVLFSWLHSFGGADNSVLAVVDKLHYSHTEETYFGKAEAVRKFAYVPADSRIDWYEDGVMIHDFTIIEPGNSVAFRTKFKEDEFSILWPVKYREWLFSIRAGGFFTRWLRPSDLDREWHFVEDNTLIVYETEFESRGLVLGIEPVGREIAGFNMSIVGHWGFDNRVSNRVNRNFRIEEGKDLLYAAGMIDAWYNWHLGGRDGRFSLTLGALIDRRIFATEIHPFRGTWESDQLHRLYGRIMFRF